MAGTITNTTGVTVTLTADTNPLTITDTGSIQTSSAYGVVGGTNITGTVTNAGTVSAASAGVYLKSVGTVTNSGSVYGQLSGVYLPQGGTIANNGRASAITGGANGVYAKSGAVALTNAGTVSGSRYGLFLKAGGTVANNGTASVISGGRYEGILGGAYGFTTVTNEGTVSGHRFGMYLRGGNVTNVGATSLITGGTNAGIYVKYGAGTITNAGTITGNMIAILFHGDDADRVVLDPGSVLNGAVQGGSGTNTLELAGTAGQAGTLTGFASQFTGFGTIAVDAGPSWSLAGAGETITAGIDLAGTLTAAESGTVALVGAVSGAGALVAAGAGLDLTAANSFTGGTTIVAGTLELAMQGAAGSTQNGSQTAGGVAFGATGTTLRIDAAAMTGGTYAAPITGFASGRTLDLHDLSYVGGNTTATYDASTDTLTVRAGLTTDTLTDFRLGAGLTTGYYTLATAQEAGGNGTDVTLSLDGPSAPTLSASSNTGANKAADDTDQSEPSFTGTADPGSTIKLYADGGTTAIGLGTANGSGVYTATVTTSLADGQHSIAATATDASSDVSMLSAATTIMVDVPPTITSDTATPAMGDLDAGKTVTFTLATSKAVMVSGNPTLSLNDGGGTATYAAAASSPTSLVFTTTIMAGQNASALAVTGVNLPNGATVQDAAGTNLATTGAAKTFNGLQVDTTAPTIISEAASPTGADLDAGKVVTFTVQTSEAVAATGSSLSLNTGATATYASGGTVQPNGSISPLIYNYTVASGDTNTADLQATTLNGTIQDGAGNPLSDASFQAIDVKDQIDTVAPTVTAVSDGGTGIDANGNGDLGAGKAVTLTVTTSEPVYVQGGKPTLTLNDGGTATYTGGSGTAQQTFSYTVVPGQNTAKLAVTAVNANGATVTDAAGNPLTPSLMSAAVPSGMLTIDTTPPVASSPTLSVAQNAPATPIGIAAPSDNLTPAGSLAIVAATLPDGGRVTLADGTTAVTMGQALTTAQLTGLEFTPTPGLSNQGSTFTYGVTDGAGNVSIGTAALDVGAAGAPTINGTCATIDGSEMPVMPFTSVTVSDPNMGTNSLTITLQNGGGTLTGTGLVSNPDGTYTLAGSVVTVTQQLDALSFTPSAPPPGTSGTTTFVLSDVSSAGTSVTDARTSVTDTAAAAPPPPPKPTPDAISINKQVSYDGSAFAITGTASSVAGVRSVEITAQVDGVATNLGAATVDADGNFSFADLIGAHQQGFITATLTDAAGVQTTSADPGCSLTGGLGPNGGVGRQTTYSDGGNVEASASLFKPNGQSTAKVEAPGQTVELQPYEVVFDRHQAGTTFVFSPGVTADTVDVVRGFLTSGVGHTTLDLPSADFANLAAVFANTGDVRGSAFITDPVTGDAVRLGGVTTAELKQHPKDIAFHA